MAQVLKSVMPILRLIPVCSDRIAPAFNRTLPAAVTDAMSYQKYWSLQKLPFGRPETADEFFPGRPQREAIARLEYLIRGGHSTGLILSPGRAGQSTLLRRIAESSGFGDCAVDIVRMGAKGRTRDELLHQFAVRLGITRWISDRYRQVSERITASGRQRVRSVWLLDDATPLAAEVASSLASDCPWLTAVLACTPEMAMKVVLALGGCSLRVDLDPFELSDTAAFVRHQVNVVGGKPEMFSDGAVVRLHELAEGRVANVARLAELTLPVAAAQKAKQINVDHVEAVEHEVVSAAA